jgi:hypothetical protein
MHSVDKTIAPSWCTESTIHVPAKPFMFIFVLTVSC